MLSSSVLIARQQHLVASFFYSLQVNTGSFSWPIRSVNDLQHFMFSFQNVCYSYQWTDYQPSRCRSIWGYPFAGEGSSWNFELEFLLEKSQRFIEVYKSSSFEGFFQDRGGKRGLSSLEERQEDITIFPACVPPIVAGWLFPACVIKTGIFLWKKL